MFKRIELTQGSPKKRMGRDTFIVLLLLLAGLTGSICAHAGVVSLLPVMRGINDGGVRHELLS